MAESEESGRIGLELYYTGRQRLDADPFRVRSRPYLIVGLLAERRLGRGIGHVDLPQAAQRDGERGSEFVDDEVDERHLAVHAVILPGNSRPAPRCHPANRPSG